MARNAASPIEAFRLPSERTVIIGSQPRASPQRSATISAGDGFGILT